MKINPKLFYFSPFFCEYGEISNAFDLNWYLYEVKIIALNMRFIFTTLIVVVIFQNTCFSQNSLQEVKDSFRVIFYNLENYFDPYVDSSLSYNEYSYHGDLHWTNKKFTEKTKNIYKVFQALSTWEGIAIAGVCEIENKVVLNELLYNTPLKKMSYNYIHYDSKDKRGIDVALIYGNQFKPLFSKPFSIVDKQNVRIPTRDILYVKGLLGNDTLHVFVNHWTSRYRGLLESNALRLQFSYLLKSKTDSLFNLNPNANILIMGDFNDQPHDESIIRLTTNSKLQNLVPNPSNNISLGTMKFRSVWFIFDQILVSNAIIQGKGNLMINNQGVKIFDQNFLLENDKKYLGTKPFRTNIGYTYHGGYSDHLPVFLDLFEK